MSGSLSTGAFSVAGGISNITGIPTNGIMLIIVMAAIILVYTISASSGIMKGIKWLSSFNVYIFSFLILFIFLFGPTKFILLNFGVESVGELMDSFFMRNLFTDSMNLGNSSWSSLGNMKVGYWANYLAWAPVTALFLGKLARDTNQGLYYHKSVCAHCFSMIWVSIFGGTAIHMHMQKV